MSELDALDPVPETVKLSSGFVVNILPLKTRQFFRLLRILTRGASPNVAADLFSTGLNDELFGLKLAASLLTSIPDAEEETISFLASMVEPNGLDKGRKLPKNLQERNDELWEELSEEIYNPELEDLVDLVEAIVKREASDLQALGKRLGAMMQVAVKTGQTKEPTSEPKKAPVRKSRARNSSVDSVVPSI